MDELAPPVVTAKPVRGREMQTTAVPTDLFDTMRVVSAKRTLRGENLTQELEKPRAAQTEYFHEGYVDGKLYLVPDSNLEAMKDIINFKMRPRRSTRYKHQTSYELSDYDHFKGKLSTLLDKIGDFSDSGSTTVEEHEPGEEETSEVSEEEVHETTEEEEASVAEEPSRTATELSKATTVTKTSEKSKPASAIVPVKKPKPDVYRARFILSGHFRENQKPIYIIQEYDGKTDIFGNQKADFFSSKKDGNIDVNISGKFYKENVLEETDGKPTALNIQPEKILIDEKKSKIYDKYFQTIFRMSTVDLILKGEFINIQSTGKSTPFITLSLKQREPEKPKLKSDYESIYSRNNATVLVFEPGKGSPFSGRKMFADRNQNNSKNNNKPHNTKRLTKTSKDGHILRSFSLSDGKGKESETKQSENENTTITKNEHNKIEECRNDTCTIRN